MSESHAEAATRRTSERTSKRVSTGKRILMETVPPLLTLCFFFGRSEAGTRKADGPPGSRTFAPDPAPTGAPTVDAGFIHAVLDYIDQHSKASSEDIFGSSNPRLNATAFQPAGQTHVYDSYLSWSRVSDQDSVIRRGARLLGVDPQSFSRNQALFLELPPDALGAKTRAFFPTTSGAIAVRDDGNVFIPSGLADEPVQHMWPGSSVTPADFFAVLGDKMTVSTDGGASFSKSNGLPSQVVDVKSYLSSPMVLAGTYSDGVYRSTDTGSTFAPSNQGLPSGANTEVNQLAISQTTAWLATTKGAFMSADFGMSWTSVLSGLPTGDNFTAVEASPDGNTVHLGVSPSTPGPARVCRSTNHGMSFACNSNGITASQINSISLAGSGSIIGTNGGVFTTPDGVNYENRSSGLASTSIFSLGYVLSSGGAGGQAGRDPETAATELILAGTAGNVSGVFRSSDRGVSWVRASSAMDNQLVTGFAEAVGSIVAATGPVSRNVHPGLYRSTDGGITWVESASGIPSGPFGYAPLTVASVGNRILASVSATTTFLFKSEDGGLTCSPSATGLPLSPPRILVSAGSTVLASLGLSGTLSRSTNSGASWSAAIKPVACTAPCPVIDSLALVLTNAGAAPATLKLIYKESFSPSAGSGGTATISLQPGEQRIIPSGIDYLRHQAGVSIGPQGQNTYVGALRVAVSGVPLGDVYAGSRIGSQSSGGGQFSTFASTIYPGSEALTEAYLYGLRADDKNRSNVAAVNTGVPADGSITLRFQAYDGDAAGAQKGANLDITLAPGEWYQEGNFLKNHGVANGWVKVTLISGTAPWITYAVINDGASSGERTGDGAYVPMVPMVS